MTHVATRPASGSAWEAGSQQGPVLLATKPYNGLDAPLAIARWLSAREERELHVVTVLEQANGTADAAGMPPLPPRYYQEEGASLANELRRALTLDGTGSDLPHVDVLEGPAAQAIVDVARDRGARVIVIGTGKHDAIGRVLYGERALEIVTLADRPVLIVPTRAVARPVALAVVATDFSAASLRAARAALPMLSAGSRLVLMHVRNAVPEKGEFTERREFAYERACEVRFRELLRQLPSLPGITVETKYIAGDPAATIVAYANAMDAGLIACGRAGHSFVQRMLVGSVSSAIVRRASCPVLVAPELPEDLA
ncbi:MAG: universal stress protein [Gemmatimonadota bacterium]|nr:universal stress protein [Gemmatimonadota bacterium]